MNEVKTNGFSKKFYSKCNKGFTLIEAMIGLAISTISVAAFINMNLTVVNDDIVKNYAGDLNNIITAVDQRISVDGYDFLKWDKTVWNSSELNQLFGSQLQGVNSKCGSGTWVPTTGDDDLSLVSCAMKDLSPFKMNVSAELFQDSLGFIKEFKLRYKFDSKNEFEKHFKDFKRVFKSAQSNVSNKVTGSFKLEMIEESTGLNIDYRKCVDIDMGCVFDATLNRLGGTEYIRADGSNSLIGSHLTYIESKGYSPLKCIRWTKSSGAWINKIDEDCGIGIYKDGINPLVVDVASENGNYKNILLNKECKTFSWSGSTVIQNGVSPCGILDSGTEIYQVVDNISAENSFLKSSYSENNTVKNLYVETVLAGTISVDFLNVLNSLKSDIIRSNSTGYVNIDDELVVSGYSVFNGGTTLNGVTNISGKLNGNSSGLLDINDDVSISGDVIIKKYLKVLNTGITEGSTCSGSNGNLSSDLSGQLLNCVNGIWVSTVASSPVGTMVMWPSVTIPIGWIAADGGSIAAYPKLKALYGSNFAPDMRGQFVRGWDQGKGVDNNNGSLRGLRTFQDDADQNFTGEFMSFDRYKRLRDLNGIVKTSSRWSSHVKSGKGDSWGTYVSLDNSRQVRTDTETRPKNYSMIFIIKTD